jgi:hypothetical protein
MMEGTYAAMALQALVTNAQETSFDEDYTVIGENIEILRKNFAASKAADKVWQIWGAAKAMGPANTPVFSPSTTWWRTPLYRPHTSQSSS